MEIYELSNANVYLTNIMLIPCIVFIGLNIKTIQKWKLNDCLAHKQFYWLIFWYILLFSFIIGICISFIYHFYMFEHRPLIHKISSLDVHFTAPLLSILSGLLFLLYFLYLKHPVKNNILTLKKITEPIFYVAFIFSVIGISSYFIRKKFVPEWKENDYIRCRFLNMHIFFHYMSYTGAILLYLLYYIESWPLFKAFFEE